MPIHHLQKQRNALSVVLFVFLIAFLLPDIVRAMEQTGNCHCFRDRVFDPANRYKSDNYLLTTVGNSLIASHFNISKKQIVMMKMQGGTSNNDLLIALYLTHLSGTDLKDILETREKKSWQDLVANTPQLKTISGDPVLTQLKEGKAIEKVSGEISNIILHKRFDLPDNTINVLKEKNLNPRETALILALSEHTGVPSVIIADQNRTKGLSWSEIAYNFGLQPADAGKLVLSSSVSPTKQSQQK